MSILTEKRKCPICEEWKSPDEFYKDKSLKSGLMAKCKVCCNAASRQWAKSNPDKTSSIFKKWRLGHLLQQKERGKKWRTENPEKHAERNRKWYAVHSDEVRESAKKKYSANLEKEREKSRERSRRQYAFNPEKIKRKLREWTKRNPDKKKKNVAKWLAKNPHKVKEYTENRRARKQQVGGTITAKQWQELLATYDHTCLCCGKTDVKLTLDHVIPLEKGGPNVISNAQPLCGSCNSKKGTKIIDYRP